MMLSEQLEALARDLRKLAKHVGDVSTGAYLVWRLSVVEAEIAEVAQTLRECRIDEEARP
ncbi:MAG: hypothetical protein ABIH23_04975 [bacterium]